MRRRKREVSGVLNSNFGNVLFSSIIGILIISVALLMFSYLMTIIDASDKIVSLMSSFALCVGAYVSGRICSKRKKKNGLVMGIMCGINIFVIVLTLGIILAKTLSASGFILKLIMCVVFAGIGGIVGVNSRKRI